MKKIVLGLVLLVLDAECMKDKRFTVMNTSSETIRVVVNLENGEFWPGVNVSRLKQDKNRPWLSQYDLGYAQDWINCPLTQFEVHPGKFKMGALINPKEEEVKRRIEEERLDVEAENKLYNENAMRGQLDFYKDEILIGSFFVGTKNRPCLQSFDVNKPEARFAVSEEANVFLRYIWWGSREVGKIIRVRPYDPKYRYPNSGEIGCIGGEQSPAYYDDPNDPRPVHPEPGNEYIHKIMTMTPEDPAPEDGCCSAW